MRAYVILLTLVVVVLVTIQAFQHSHSRRRYYRGDLCCARAHTCYNFTPISTCEAIEGPSCPQNSPIYRRCRQNRDVLLMAVYFRPFLQSRTLCCTVVNCPQILFSECSYQTEKCNFAYGICTPRRYKRYRLQIVCPNSERYVVYRYLPYCCSCRMCNGHYKPYKQAVQ